MIVLFTTGCQASEIAKPQTKYQASFSQIYHLIIYLVCLPVCLYHLLKSLIFFMHFLHSPVCHFSSPLPLFIFFFFFFLSTFSLFSYRSFSLPALWWQIANCTLHKGFTCTTTTLLTVLIKSEGGKTLSNHWILAAGRITKPLSTDLTASQKEWEENSKNWVTFLFPIPLRGQSLLLSKLFFDMVFCYRLNCIPPHCMLKS